MVPDLDKPDDIIEDLFTAWFGPGLIVTAFVILNFVMSWFDFIKGAVKQGRAFARFLRVGPLGAAFGFMEVVAAIAIQLCWLWFVFLTGNLLSFVFQQRGRFEDPDLTWARLTSSLEWDGITTAYFGLAVLMLIAAYLVPEDKRWPAIVTALPPLYIVIPGFFAVLAAIVAGGLGLLAGADLTTLFATIRLGFWLVLLGFYALYAASCVVVAKLPFLIRRAIA
jgi:hypothetical protein